MSTTVRVSKQDRERLVNLARKLKTKSIAEALRKAIEMAEEGDERFTGNLAALKETLGYAGERGARVSEQVDEELAKLLTEPRARKAEYPH